MSLNLKGMTGNASSNAILLEASYYTKIVDNLQGKSKTYCSQQDKVFLLSLKIKFRKSSLVVRTNLSLVLYWIVWLKNIAQQESIPVGCILLACLLYVLWWSSIVSTTGRGRGLQWGPMNKFEQVSSDGHQISLAGGMGLGCPYVPCLISWSGLS